MRIKKLELCGFKSFKDRTVLHFDEGITGVVGPNGCGKSNIVDALVWVMGEMSAKHLRGANMSDVIFAGAEGYAPVGLAEVSLTLENDGGPFPAKYMRHSEIMVTRRLHRSGETEYLINKEPARLRDIQEIFMDTGAGSKGFSIVEQGQIGKIITAKPEERRTLIEEAAGITKFKVRKRESQKKLQSTDQNLLRLQDIIGEQKRQLESLQRQAQRAERYRKVKDELRDKEMWLSARKFLALEGEAQAAQSIFDHARETEASSGSNIGQMQAELEEKRLAIAEKEISVQELQTRHQKAQAAVSEKELMIREFNFEIEQARRNKEMTGSFLQQHQVRRDALLKDQEQLEARLESSREAATDFTLRFEEKNQSFTGIQDRIRTVDEQLTQKRREMLTVSQSESSLQARLLSLDNQLGDHQERVETSRTVLSEIEGKCEEFEKRQKKVYNELELERQMQLDIMKDVTNFEENLNLLGQETQKKQDEVAHFKDELGAVTGKLYGLENLHANFEGFQEGVKNVILWQRSRKETQVHADGQVSEFFPVAEVVEVDQQYELAMEAALGNRLQMLLAHEEREALEAVDYLKEQKSGRSSFFAGEWTGSESASEAQESVKSEEGVQALLADVARVPDVHRKQVAHFLNGVVIVDGIRTALRLRPSYPGMTFVTIEGDTLTADGVLTGGNSENAESGVLKRRREIKELSQKREEAAGKLALAQASLKKLEAQHKQMAEELESAKRRQNEKEIRMAELKKDLERATNEASNARSAVERQKQEVSRLEAQLLTFQNQKEELASSYEDMVTRRVELEALVETLGQELKQSQEGIDDLRQEVSELRVQSASKKQEVEGLSHQLELVARNLAEVESQLQQMSAESERSVESLSTNQILVEESRVALERLIRESQELERSVASARDEFEKMSAATRQLDEQVSKTMANINQQKAQMNEAQLKLEQLRMKEQYLLDQINERYMVDLREVAPQFADREGDVDAAERDVEELKDRVKKLGEVNLSAIQEYDELATRYEFLTKQHQDLLDAKEQLRKVIDRINRICSKRFKETFEQVNERFVKVFPVLFGGGEARLTLVEDVEKGEMGIEMLARPPGKKLQNVTLLSGGEKALTAVALIFSIFLVKPSPFCLLDEVDAPLDDANVFRFNDLVKEMAKRSQIIVVTHNKHTMRINNKLFGVTMEEKGVSKMVSVSLEEAQRVVEAG